MSTKRKLTNLFLVALVLYVLVVIAVCFREFNPPYTFTRFGGRAVSRDEWPKPLVEFVRDMERKNAPVEGLDVYLDSDNAYYWKCDATPKLLESMTARWTLRQADKRRYRTITIFLNRIPPAFSSLAEQFNEDTIFYVSKEIKPEGTGKGDLYWVALSPNGHDVIVRYSLSPYSHVDDRGPSRTR
jgi:hypothetical protein